MNARLLKRNISTDAPIEPPKRPKLRKPLDTRYETPHPSLLSSDSAFKLPSSVGPAESPSKFSPIPSTKRTHRRTSSTNLKENASVLQTSSPFPQPKQRYRRVKKYGKASRRRPVTLESPFNSCSSSASSASSPESLPNPRTLSDLRLNTNISRQASHSTVSSPILVESPIRLRRPSAPTPPRISSWNYVPSHTVSAIDLHAPPSDPEFHLDADLPPDAFYPIVRPSPNHSQLDFNRPPSQLSMYDYNRSVTLEDAMDVDKADPDAFFSDVRGTSTPFKHLGSLGVTDRRFGGTMDPTAFTGSALSLQSAAEFPDTDTDSDPDGCSDEDMEASRPFRLLQQAWKNKSKARSGYVTPSEDSDEEMGPRSPWISDSLISPPKTADWALVPGNPKHSAYKQAGSADPDDDMAMDEEQRIPEQVLEGLLDNLMIGKLPTRSVSHSQSSNCYQRNPMKVSTLLLTILNRNAFVSRFEPALSILRFRLPFLSSTRRLQ
ncbi:hypothetical protein GYMLUDRAFT_72991 [Collybiopsis luxurians FD-317 M1]|uniref:Uncharacterized protein n=1 Tax=Collybiopsis luxurians FD-317 M1 TaxID=944289 RepID=A0A0D0BE02_9AGAR|nr:hypothetical protein GYMLUDRAFT_72991 [Collybiopsis luxurians FD-317 M1]